MWEVYQNLITSYCYSAKSVQAWYDTAPQPVLKFDVSFNRNDEENNCFFWTSNILSAVWLLYAFTLILETKMK